MSPCIIHKHIDDVLKKSALHNLHQHWLLLPVPLHIKVHIGREKGRHVL